jgi:hypothetical protein
MRTPPRSWLPAMIVACPRPQRLPESRSDARFERTPVLALGCHRRPEDAGRVFTNLTPASERQDHTTSPYASKFSSAREVRAATLMRPPHPAFNVRDDRETPLIERGTRSGNTDFGKKRKRNIFGGRAGQVESH